MRAFWILTRLRVLDVLRSRSATLFFLGLPIVILVVVGVVFFHGQPFERRVLVIVDEAPSAGPAALDEVRRRLAHKDGLVLEVAPNLEPALRRLRARTAVGLLIRESAGRGTSRLRVLVGGRDTIWGRGLMGILPPSARLERVEVPRLGYVHYLFPGLVAFGIVLSGLFGMGHSMVRYRGNLLLKKLATTPLRRSTFVASQLAARTVLVLAQVALLVAAGVLLFGLSVRAGSIPVLIAIVALGLLTFMGAGFALACLIKTEDLSTDVITAVNTPLVLLSEMFFPAAVLPAPLPAVADLLPSTHLVRLLREVLVYGVTAPAALAPGIAMLGAWAVATFGLGLLAFRWHR